MRSEWRPVAPGTDRYKDKWKIAAGVTTVSVMELVDTSIINVAIPQMRASLSATLDEITWISIGYILAAIAIIPMAGWLSASLGRKRYYLASVAVFTAASLCCGLSGSLTAMVFWRVLQGAGGAAFLSVSQAILQDAFPPEEKVHAAAVYGIGMMCGPALGPTLGGFIIQHWSWPWIFYVNIPMGVGAYLLLSRCLAASALPSRRDPLDLKGLALMSVGLVSLQLMLERGEHYGWLESRFILGLALLAPACLIGMVAWEMRCPHPFLNFRVLKDRCLRYSCLFSLVLGVVVFSNLFLAPLYIQTVLGYDAQKAGWIAFPGAVASAVIMILIAKKGQRIDPGLLMSIGTGLMLVSMYMHSRFTARMDPGDLFLPTVIRGIGTGMMFLPLGTRALQNLRGRDLTEGSSLFTLMRQVGGSLGIALATTWITGNAARYRYALGDRLTEFDPSTRDWLETARQGLAFAGAGGSGSEERALGLLDMSLGRDAAVLSFNTAFTWLGWIMVLGIPVILLLRRSSAGTVTNPGFSE